MIQVQCRLARAEAVDPDPELTPATRGRLLDREAELFRVHGKSWFDALWSSGVPRTKYRFRRGFIETMTSPIANATRHADAIVDALPLLSDLELSVDGQADRTELAAPKSDALLARARALAIAGRHPGKSRGGLGPIGRLDGLAKISFARLRALSLHHLRVDGDELAELLASSALAELEALSLRLGIDDAVLQRVIDRGPAIASVRQLDLAHNPIGYAGARILARSGLLDAAVTIDLEATRLTSAGLEVLLERPLPRLERLALGWNGLDRGAVLSLAAWGGGPNLRELILRHPFTDADRDALLAAPNRRALRTVIVAA